MSFDPMDLPVVPGLTAAAKKGKGIDDDPDGELAEVDEPVDEEEPDDDSEPDEDEDDAKAKKKKDGLTAASPGRARSRKIAEVMREFKAGKLKSSDGTKVTSRKQALAIAMSESADLTAAADPMDLPAAAPPGARPDDAVQAAAFTQPMREKLAKKGQAMKDGSFPIRNRSDLRNAISSVGRASDPDKARAWIIRRARELKAVHELPASWNITASGELTAAGFFEESKHPRHKKGSAQGGEFAPKSRAGLHPDAGHSPASRDRAGLHPTSPTRPFDINKERADIERRVREGQLTTAQGQALTEQAWAAHQRLSPAASEAAKLNPKNWQQIREDMDVGAVEAQMLFKEIQSEKLVEGPGGRMMSRTEQGELLDKQRAGTPSAKADRAAKRMREEGDTPAYLQTPNQETPESRLAAARATKNYDKKLDVEPEPEIAALADRFKTPRDTLTTEQHVLASFPELSPATAKAVSNEVKRRQRLEGIRAGRVRYTDGHV